MGMGGLNKVEAIKEIIKSEKPDIFAAPRDENARRGGHGTFMLLLEKQQM